MKNKYLGLLVSIFALSAGALSIGLSASKSADVINGEPIQTEAIAINSSTFTSHNTTGWTFENNKLSSNIKVDLDPITSTFIDTPQIALYNTKFGGLNYLNRLEYSVSATFDKGPAECDNTTYYGKDENNTKTYGWIYRGLIPYYVNDDNYIMVAMEWNYDDTAGRNNFKFEAARFFLTGRMGGIDIECLWSNNQWSKSRFVEKWADGNHINLTNKFTMTVTLRNRTLDEEIEDDTIYIDVKLQDHTDNETITKTALFSMRDPYHVGGANYEALTNRNIQAGVVATNPTLGSGNAVEVSDFGLTLTGDNTISTNTSANDGTKYIVTAPHADPEDVWTPNGNFGFSVTAQPGKFATKGVYDPNPDNVEAYELGQHHTLLEGISNISKGTHSNVYRIGLVTWHLNGKNYFHSYVEQTGSNKPVVKFAYKLNNIKQFEREFSQDVITDISQVNRIGVIVSNPDTNDADDLKITLFINQSFGAETHVNGFRNRELTNQYIGFLIDNLNLSFTDFMKNTMQFANLGIDHISAVYPLLHKLHELKGGCDLLNNISELETLYNNAKAVVDGIDGYTIGYQRGSNGEHIYTTVLNRINYLRNMAGSASQTALISPSTTSNSVAITIVVLLIAPLVGVTLISFNKKMKKSR